MKECIVEVALWSNGNSAAFVFVESSSFGDLSTTVAFVPFVVPSQYNFRLFLLLQRHFLRVPSHPGEISGV